MFTAVALSLAVVFFFINYKTVQDRDYEVIRINPDVLVLLSGLFTPLVLFGFAFMVYSSNHLDKEVLFGSSYISYYEDDLNNIPYRNEAGVKYYSHNILYEDNFSQDIYS